MGSNSEKGCGPYSTTKLHPPFDGEKMGWVEGYGWDGWKDRGMGWGWCLIREEDGGGWEEG